MSINYPINNILHSILFQKGISNLNIAYNKSNSLYDLTIDELDRYEFIDDKVLSEDRPICYGLCFINDPIGFSQNLDKYKRIYANKVLFLHNAIPSFFKKEDIFLMNSHLNKYPAYTFTAITNDILPQKQYIKYGLKDRVRNKSSNRETNVIILYNSEEKQARVLHGVISSKFSNIEMLDTKSIKDISTITEKLNNTKICIDTTEYFNVLFGLSCGCYGLTSVVNEDSEFISRIDNFETCLNIIDKTLSSYNDKFIDDSINYVQENYNYDKYVATITNIILNNYYKSVNL